VRRFAPLLALFPFVACESVDYLPHTVRTTLDDGQVLVGRVHTEVLLLEGGLGLLEIPLDDVGEVVPVEGEELASSGGFVNVWLRNGSELRGRWAEPELQMGLEMGGEEVAVDLPVAELVRIQTQGAESWAHDDVFRVRTTHGDDFLVDGQSTRVALENELGVFAPFLDECASISPYGDPGGEWTVSLLNGTVLKGEMVEDELSFALTLGPEEVVVPLDLFVSLERQYWDYPLTPRPAPVHASPVTAAPEEQWAAPPRQQGDWFVSDRFVEVK